MLRPPFAEGQGRSSSWACRAGCLSLATWWPPTGRRDNTPTCPSTRGAVGAHSGPPIVRTPSPGAHHEARMGGCPGSVRCLLLGGVPRGGDLRDHDHLTCSSLRGCPGKRASSQVESRSDRSALRCRFCSAKRSLVSSRWGRWDALCSGGDIGRKGASNMDHQLEKACPPSVHRLAGQVHDRGRPRRALA